MSYVRAYKKYYCNRRLPISIIPEHYAYVRLAGRNVLSVTSCHARKKRFEESQVVWVEVEKYVLGRFRVRGIDFRWFQHLRRPPKVAPGHLENVTRCDARMFQIFGRMESLLGISIGNVYGKVL